MLQMLDRLRTADEAARAAAHGIHLAGLFVDVAHRMAAADGARRRKPVGLGRFRPLVHHHVDDLRDHVPCPLDDHHVADTNVAPIADRSPVLPTPRI